MMAKRSCDTQSHEIVITLQEGRIVICLLTFSPKNYCMIRGERPSKLQIIIKFLVARFNLLII